jgi:alpha-beta hydrolase superfamily lysophospholipase
MEHLTDRTGITQLFADQTYHFQALRVLTDAPAGGADINEVLQTIGRIPEGDASRWYEEFAALGEANLLRANSCLDQTSAGLAFLRAHTYWRTAEFLLKPDDPRRSVAWPKHVSAFDQALTALGVDYRRFDVPYEHGALRCIFYPGAAGAGDKPLIMFVGGYDSTLEELYLVLAKAASERGYDVLTYEGPGQGAALREDQLYFTSEYEKPNSAVLDAYLAQTDRPPRNIILVGMSMGGYLAPRAAAFDPRIDGVVAYDVFFDLGETARAFFAKYQNPELAHLPGIVWSIDNAVWTLGLKEASEVPSAFSPYTLSSCAHQISADVLILVGEHDHFVPPQQATQFAQSLTHARSVETVVYDAASGGAEHCQLGAVTLWHETFFDWLIRRFG